MRQTLRIHQLAPRSAWVEFLPPVSSHPHRHESAAASVQLAEVRSPLSYPAAKNLPMDARQLEGFLIGLVLAVGLDAEVGQKTGAGLESKVGLLIPMPVSV